MNHNRVTPGAKELDKDVNAGAATDKGDLIPVRKSDHGTWRCHARVKKNLGECRPCDDLYSCREGAV